MSVDIKEQYDKLYKYCCFKVGDAALAEDLTQEAFLRYFSQCSYIDRGKQLAYLYTIAKHLCADAFRGKRTERLDEDFPAGDETGPTELQISLKQALRILPALQQELLLLRYVNGFSVEEIGRLTGLSRFAVYRKTQTALTRLKTRFKEEDFF